MIIETYRNSTQEGDVKHHHETQRDYKTKKAVQAETLPLSSRPAEIPVLEGAEIGIPQARHVAIAKITAMVLLSLLASLSFFLCLGKVSAGFMCHTICPMSENTEQSGMVEYIGDSLSPNYLGGDNHCPPAVTVTLTVSVTVTPPTPTQPPPEPSAAPAVCPPQGPSPADPTAKERLWQFFVSAAGSGLGPFLSFLFKAVWKLRRRKERQGEAQQQEKKEGDERGKQVGREWRKRRGMKKRRGRREGREGRKRRGMKKRRGRKEGREGRKRRGMKKRRGRKGGREGRKRRGMKKRRGRKGGREGRKRRGRRSQTTGAWEGGAVSKSGRGIGR